jgi:hypothetical protein
MNLRCPVHNVKLICFCPACRGGIKTERKARSSRQNGKLGGRPKGSTKNRKRGKE